jgi:uncharacterized protein YkwD
VESIKEVRKIVGALFLAIGLLAPGFSVQLPPLPQPIQELLSPSSTSNSQPQQSSSPRPTVAAIPAFARSIVAELNRARIEQGLRPLRQSSVLTAAAVAHATALATRGQFTHSWPDGRPFPTWIRPFYSARGYRIWSVGENLLWSTPGIDAATVVERWLASPTHRHILLTPSWREVGLGVVSATAAPGTYGGNDVDVVAAEFGTRIK